MESYLEEEMDLYTENQMVKALSTESLNEPIKSLNLVPATLISSATTVAEAVKIMQDKNFGALLVSDKNKLTGIITERDILRKVAGRNLEASKVTVNQIMTPNPEALEMSDQILYAMNLMVVGGYRHVPIVDDKRKPISILSIRDIVKHLSQFFEAEIQNLPPKPLRENQDREGA